ncbi:MAG: ribonuclease III [Saprospiraceae bacterium]|nr:ribonuclease III [Saprospiraceae bacterium]
MKPILGFVPSNMALFQQAFFHKSNNNNQDSTGPKVHQNNERLEYLGDALLSTIVAEYLFKKYPNSDEGFLTKMRAKIVKRKTLNDIGDRMGLDMLLLEYNSTKLSKSMMGNALEALVGAVYLEKGYDITRRFVVNRILRAYLDIHKLEKKDDNFKSQLLEWCQKNGLEISYEVLDRFKVDKRDRFKVAVLVDGAKMGEAEEFNKKSAEQIASRIALSRIHSEEISAGQNG